MQVTLTSLLVVILIRTYIVRFITLVVALQLLNLSIYAQDFKPLCKGGCLGEMNITETISEFMVEVVLGHKNAIPEQQQHHKDLHFHKNIDFKIVNFSKDIVLSFPPVQSSKKQVLLHEAFEDNYLQEINPEPPKA